MFISMVRSKKCKQKRSVLRRVLKYMENASENFNKENRKGTRKNIIMLNLLTSTCININNFIMCSCH